MISKSKTALALLGAVIVLSVMAVTITNSAYHPAVDQSGSESSTAQPQTPRTRSWEAEEFYRKYVCDHACRYSKW
jgi:hypothetical protein